MVRFVSLLAASTLILFAGAELFAHPYPFQAVEARTSRDDDESRRREEADRVPRFDRSTVVPSPNSATLSFPRRFTESCIAPLKNEDPSYDAASLPLTDWVSAGEVSQIPWKFQMQDPRLRLDQRYEVSFSSRIDKKDLRWSPEMPHELIYVTGIRSAGNEWVMPPKSVKYVFDQPSGEDVPDFRIVATDCVFVQPGEYSLWVAVFDPENGKRTVEERRIRTAVFKSDPLPQLNSRMPTAEFPKVDSESGPAIEIKPPEMALAVSNKRPLSIELVTLLSPSDQWSGRTDLIRWQNNRLLAVTGALSQLRPANGAVSLTAVDIVNRTTPFEQTEFSELDWPGLAAQFTKFGSDQVIALPALESAKKRSSFLREMLEARVAKPADKLRVLILISGSVEFERGSDLSAMKVPSDCNCRVYHLLVHANAGDAFDQVERLIKPLRPKSFDIESALEFREALGRIVQDLNGL